MSELGSLAMYISLFLLSVILIYIAYSNLTLKMTSSTRRFFRLTIVGMALAIPILIGGFRYMVGTDYGTYVQEYDSIINGVSSGGSIDIGYVYLVTISNFIGGSSTLLFTAYSFITVLFIFLAIKRLVPHKFIWLAYAVILFTFFPQSFNMMRQIAAVAVVLFAYSYIFRKSHMKFLLTIAAASLLHISALVILPVYALINGKNMLKVKKKGRLLGIISPALIYTAVLYFTLTLVASGALDFIVPERYAGYLTYGTDFLSNITFYIATAAVAGSILILKLLAGSKRDVSVITLISIFAFSVPFAMAGFFSFAANRLSLYVLPTIGPIVFLYLVYLTSNYRKTHFVLKVLALAVAISYFVIIYYMLGWSEIFPYSSILSPEVL